MTMPGNPYLPGMYECNDRHECMAREDECTHQGLHSLTSECRKPMRSCPNNLIGVVCCNPVEQGRPLEDLGRAKAWDEAFLKGHATGVLEERQKDPSYGIESLPPEDGEEE